jgi:hypothetical protein
MSENIYAWHCTALQHWLKLSCINKVPLRRGVLDTTLCDIVCQWLATGWWFSLGPPVSSINKTERHDITEILLKVALNTIILPVIAKKIPHFLLIQLPYDHDGPLVCNKLVFWTRYVYLTVAVRSDIILYQKYLCNNPVENRKWR